MPTIGLVDDDHNILTSISIGLEAEGYRIMTYTDGASALDGFKISPPDLAILDIKMPRMDGMETLRRLRQKSDMPVIFLTSKEEEIDELFGFKMGADDFIRKPFSHRLLAERVRALLRRSTPKEGATNKEAEEAKVLERGSWSAAIVDELAVDPSDIEVAKYRMSGFQDTELDSILRNLGVSTLMFAGVNADQCVLCTLQDANFRGYDCLLLEDCAATTSPDYCLAATIYNVRQCFGFVVGSEAITAELDHSERNQGDAS